MKRRTVLQATLAGAAALALPHASRAQTSRKLSYLTWNIADQEQLFKEEFADFRTANPGVEIEWLDKKGTELPAFYQTQLVAGTAPDVVDLQGAIGRVRGERRAARPHAVPEEGARGRQAIQPGLSGELAVSGEELHASLLHRQDASLLQQDAVQGSRVVGPAADLRRTAELRPENGEGRKN